MFEEMKQNRKTASQKVRELFKAETEQQKQDRHVRHEVRAVNALRRTGNAALARRIFECDVGRYCSSFYCYDCRHRAASALETRTLSYLMPKFDAAPNYDQLVYVTALEGLTLMNAGDVAETMALARKHLAAIKRSFPRLWIEGVIEFELVQLDAMLSYEGANRTKRDTLQAMAGERDQEAHGTGDRILVHWHALVDLNGEDRTSFEARLRKIYRAHGRQVHCQLAPQSGQPIREMIRKVSSYPFKSRVKFNMTFETTDYENGDYFTDGQLAALATIYDGVRGNGYKSLLINIKPQE